MTSEPVGDVAPSELTDEEQAHEDPVVEAPPEPTVPEPAPFVQTRFLDIAVALPSTNPVVVLEEVGYPNRLVRIPIGLPEGVAIGYAARGLSTPKPLTHELFMTVLEAFSVTVDYVRITAVHDQAFSAELVCSGGRGSRTVPCRPSDGIALALRQRLGAPIMVAPDVLERVGVIPPG
jgi:uncharacterized protein